jgi:tetratricopeptide (TPR) repeat protein
VGDNTRIEDLRRRVQKDPASIAFAQLAEEFRRAGQFQESVDVCRAGLVIHPGYLSARVTLGRALLELNQLDDAQSELEQVLKSARENLAAIRGLAEIHHRRGELGEALTQYRAALALARNDPELAQTVSELSRQIEPPKAEHSGFGLSFEQARRELSLHTAIAEPEIIALPPALVPSTPLAPAPFVPTAEAPSFAAAIVAPASPPSQTESIEDDSTRARAARTIVALEQWLEASHVARAHRRA